MPPWEEGNDKWGSLTIPDVYLKGTSQLYPTGTIFRKGLRTFIYTLTDAVFYAGGAGHCIAGYLVESCSQRKTLANSIITAALGAFTIKVNYGGACAKDAYAGGFIGIVMGTGLTVSLEGACSSFQIISNTKQDGSNHVTFTLDGPLPALYPADSDVILTEHPYAKVRSPQQNPFGMCVGVMINTHAGGKYLWVQTGGPCNMLHVNATFEGDEAYSIPFVVVGHTGNRIYNVTTDTIGGTSKAQCMQRIGHAYASNLDAADGSPTVSAFAEAIWLDIFS